MLGLKDSRLRHRTHPILKRTSLIQIMSGFKAGTKALCLLGGGYG